MSIEGYVFLEDATGNPKGMVGGNSLVRNPHLPLGRAGGGDQGPLGQLISVSVFVSLCDGSFVWGYLFVCVCVSQVLCFPTTQRQMKEVSERKWRPQGKIRETGKHRKP